MTTPTSVFLLLIVTTILFTYKLIIVQEGFKTDGGLESAMFYISPFQDHQVYTIQPSFCPRSFVQFS